MIRRWCDRTQFLSNRVGAGVQEFRGRKRIPQSGDAASAGRSPEHAGADRARGDSRWLRKADSAPPTGCASTSMEENIHCRVVDQVMQRISAANPRLDSERVAVLAALNLAEELHRLRREYEELMELLDERTRAPMRSRA
jgi:hypothetical protein